MWGAAPENSRPITCDKNIRRLDVPVQQALARHMLQCIDDASGQVEPLLIFMIGGAHEPLPIRNRNVVRLGEPFLLILVGHEY